jgi:GT2 family glycosyltransferase
VNKKANRLAVVTVTYNSGPVLDEFFQSVSKQTLADFKLYAIDNASRDDTMVRLHAAEKSESRLEIIANADNLGVAEGNNQGIRLALEAGCTHVLLLNNDTVFPEDMFETLMRIAESGEHPVVVPKIYYHSEPRRIWFGGGRFLKARGHMAVHIGDGEIDSGQFDKDCAIEYSPTTCMLIAAPVFRSVGLMDERYFVYLDDTDFCLRAVRAGIPIWYTHLTHLYHKIGASTGGEASPFTVRMGTRNRVYYFRKHFSWPAAVYFSSAYFAYMVMRWVTGRDSWTRFRLKTRSFAEGLRM